MPSTISWRMRVWISPPYSESVMSRCSSLRILGDVGIEQIKLYAADMDDARP